MSLCHLFRRGLFGPTPFLFELFVHEADTPACLLVDLFENLENFLLLTAIGEYLACVRERANGYRGDAAVYNVSKLCQLVISEWPNLPVFDMSGDATDHLRMSALQVCHLSRNTHTEIGVDLRQQQHRCVIEQSCHDRCSLDQPHFWEAGFSTRMVRIDVGHRLHGLRNARVPRVSHVLEAIPLFKSMLRPDLFVSWIWLHRPWHGRSEVAHPRDDVEHTMCPSFLPPVVCFRSQVHVDLPVIWIPSDLPVEV